MSSDRQFIIDVIELYKELPCLWKKADPDYYDKNKRDIAMEKLVDLFKTKDKKADRDMVLRKITSMRGCYRKEYHKVKKSLKSGACTDEVHIPKLWYYDLLTFLEDQNLPNTSRTVESVLDNTSTSRTFKSLLNNTSTSRTMESVLDNTSTSRTMESLLDNTSSSRTMESVLDNMPFGYDEGCEEDSNESASSSDTRLQGSSKARIKSQRFKWPKKRSLADQVLEKIAKRMDQTLEKPSTMKQRHDSFGEYVAEKLRSMQPNMAIYCQKIINDAIFLAETGNLNISSKIVTSLSTDMIPVKSEYVSNVE